MNEWMNEWYDISNQQLNNKIKTNQAKVTVSEKESVEVIHYQLSPVDLQPSFITK